MTAEIHRLPVRPRPRPVERDPCDRGVNGLAMNMAEIKRQELRDAASRKAEPKDELPHFADLRDGGNLFDYSDDGPAALLVMSVILTVALVFIGALTWWVG